MLKGRFTYSAAQHIYRVGPWEVPGISAILRAGGRVSERYYTREGRTRGSVAHELTELLDLRVIDLEHIDTAVRGYILAYAQFVADHRPTHTLIEGPVLNRHLGFATTIDRAGRLLGASATWNIKTSPPAEWHAVQRAGEVLALDGRASRRKRYTLYIRDTGKYHLEEHRNPADFEEFEDDLLLWREQCHHPNRHAPLAQLRPLLAASLRLHGRLPHQRRSSGRSRSMRRR